MIVAISSSCNIDEEITTTLPPSIVLDSDTGIYSVKVGREIVIAPSYDSAEGASYRWTMNREVIGTGSSLTFYAEAVGKYYITLTVTADGGVDEEEIRVDVLELEVPTVSIAGNKHQMVAVGTTVKLTATVRETTLPTTLTWSINDEAAGTEPTLSFEASTIGTYTLCATATNEDGTHSDTMTIEVVNPEDMPFVWEFDREAYHTVVGRKLRIAPTTIGQMEGVTYTWAVDGSEDVISEESGLTFVAESTGEFNITATATAYRDTGEVSIMHKFVVTVYEEGAYRRAINASSKADWCRVYDYTPAPGQFINELKTGGFDGTQTTMEAAIAYAEKRMRVENWVALGGFGGYIIVGFDHSIDNSGDYDFGIKANSFAGSSEPGIVWVMQDENGNGEPDDTWYELAGSETGKATTIQNYSVTYYRPAGPMMPVQWTDNLGNYGEVDYLKQFHRQDYYYPLWIEEDSYTLTGTCLEPRNRDASGNGSYWVNAEYDWGYSDNYSPVDRLTEDDNAEGEVNANHFKISNAIDCECEPIHLDYIDFVKVQVGVNAKSGWLGELSTEVCGFFDYNMKK